MAESSFVKFSLEDSTRKLPSPRKIRPGEKFPAQPKMSLYFPTTHSMRKKTGKFHSLQSFPPGLEGGRGHGTPKAYLLNLSNMLDKLTI